MRLPRSEAIDNGIITTATFCYFFGTNIIRLLYAMFDRDFGKEKVFSWSIPPHVGHVLRHATRQFLLVCFPILSDVCVCQ